MFGAKNVPSETPLMLKNIRLVTLTRAVNVRKDRAEAAGERRMVSTGTKKFTSVMLLPIGVNSRCWLKGSKRFG